MFFIGVVITSPRVQVGDIELPPSARIDEIVDVEIAGKVTGGPGSVVLWAEVPEPFQLVEGSNYNVVAKEFKEKSFRFAYKIRCTKCGNYTLAVGYETRHGFGLRQAQVSMKEGGELKVLPKIPKIRRMRLPVRVTRKVYPSESIAKIGPLSTDFREIRSYVHGDPFKSINWKASARAAGRGKALPMVNEYEREGKLSILIFLDANPELRIGTSFENALEHGIQAAYTISYHLLSKGYNVGMYIYNHRGKPVYFDTGRKQFIRISETLLRLTPRRVGLQVSWDEGLSAAVQRSRKYLLTQASGIIIITHANKRNQGDLLDGLRRMLLYKRRRQHNILLLNVLPYDLIPKHNNWEKFAGEMLEVTSRSLSDHLRDLGLTVLDWNPEEGSMEAILLSTTLLG